MTEGDEPNDKTPENAPVAPIPSVGPTLANLIPPDIASKLPPEIRQTLDVSLMAMGPAQHPLAQHITPEHIHKLIDSVENDNARQAAYMSDRLKDRKHFRLTACVATIVLIVVMGLLWGFLPKDRLETFKDVAKEGILIMGVGFGSYGFAKRKPESD